MLLRLVPALAVILVFATYAMAADLLPDTHSGLNGPAHATVTQP